MERADWINLNGLWNYAISPVGQAMPQSYDGRILVPFAVESACPEWGKVLGRRMNFGISVNSRFPPNGKDIGSYCILGLLTGKRMFG